jgi:hypothetical protein
MRRSTRETFVRTLSVLTVPLVMAMLLSAGTFGCSRGKDEASAPPSIEGEPGMKYYVGGPVIETDKYNRPRLSGFNGEVQIPTTRGLLLGYKENPDHTIVFRTWLNGVPIQRSEGFLDDDGLIWYRDRLSYDQKGRVIARQHFEYDDAKKIMHSRIDHIDPDNGTVIKSIEQDIPYTPPQADDDQDDAAPQAQHP